MTKVQQLRILLAATLGLTLLLGNVAVADHQRAICFVEARASTRLELGYVLDARLVTTDGRPVNEATVRFYESVDFFGTREMLLGSAMTDGQGRASFTYLPAQVGTHEIIVKFAGRDHFLATTGRTTLLAEVAAEPYVVEPAPLASFTAKVPYAVGSLVLAVWALIGFALIGTARGVIGGARSNIRKGDTA
jgi:hypothetical protein